MKHENKILLRIFEGLIITIVGGVIVFMITTGSIPGVFVDDNNKESSDDVDISKINQQQSDKDEVVSNDSTLNSSNEESTANVKNMDGLNGFIIDDIYYSLDGHITELKADEPQNNIRVIFEGAEVEGWTVQIMYPDSSFAVVLTNSYNQNIDFTATNGIYELQVYTDDGEIETVYHEQLEITSSDTYTVELVHMEQHVKSSKGN